MANDFSSDSNCVALWKFESGALTTDSEGGNTLVPSGTPDEDTSIYKEGACAVDYQADSYHLITDTNLDSGFPLKNGDSIKIISAAFWYYIESNIAWGSILSKHDASGGKRCLNIANNLGRLNIILGWNGGASNQVIDTGLDFTEGRWYHIGFVLDGVNKTCIIRVWDDTAQSLVLEDTPSVTNELYVSTPNFNINYDGNSTGTRQNMKMDEVVIFKRRLTTLDIDAIRGGTYSGTGFTTTTTTTSSTTSTTTTTSPPTMWNVDVLADTWSYAAGSNSRNYRIVLYSADIYNGNDGSPPQQVRILFEGHDTEDVDFDGCSIGLTINGEDFNGAPTRVTFDGGSSTVTISAGTQKFSDWIDFDYANNNNALVHFYEATAQDIAYQDKTAGSLREAPATGDDTMVEDITGYTTLPYHYHIEYIEVRDKQATTTTSSTTTTTTTTTSSTSSTVSTTTTTYPVWYTDFSEYDTESPPDDWTERWHTTAAARDIVAGSGFGSKYYNIAASVQEKYMASWDDIGTPIDVEILARVRADSGGEWGQRLTVRASGTTTTEEGYWGTFDPVSNDYGIAKYISGGAGQLISGDSRTFEHDVWYWVRFRVQGTSLKLKIWEGPYTHEPSSWDIETTDSDISGGGWVGFGCNDVSANSDYDFMSVVEGGGTAPYPSEGPFTTTTTSSTTTTTTTTTSSTSSTVSTTTTTVPGAARYWRINCTEANASPTQVGCLWSWWDTDGNLLDQTGLTYASDDEDAGNSIEKLKTDRTTLQQFSGSLPSYVSVDFGTPVSIGALMLQADDTWSSRQVKAFDIEYSYNNSDWFNAESFSGQIDWSGWEQRLFKVDSEFAPNGASGFKGWGIELTESNDVTYCQGGCEWYWKDSESVTLNDSGETAHDQIPDANGALNLSDADTGTVHQVSESALPADIGCIWTSAQIPVSVTLKASPTYNARQVKAFNIIKSLEGIWWFDTGVTYSGETAWGASEERVFSLTGPTTTTSSTTTSSTTTTTNTQSTTTSTTTTTNTQSTTTSTTSTTAPGGGSEENINNTLVIVSTV